MATLKQGEFKTGRECDTWCNKCKLDLAHTVVAIVDGWPVHVICNTCGSKHRFKKPKSAKVAKTKASSTGTKRRSVAAGAKARSDNARAMTPAEARNRWLDLLARSPSQEHRRYTVKENFTRGETLMHKKFGPGVVLEELQAQNKIRVLFEDSEKVLVVNYGKK